MTSNVELYSNEEATKLYKTLRVEAEEVVVKLQSIKTNSPREHALAITKLQEYRMWLGMALSNVGEPYPYPNGNNPDSPYVDPKADTK